MLNLSKLIYRFNAIKIKMYMEFFGMDETVLKFL